LPATSVAVTSKVFGPAVAVSMGWPSSTVPSQESMPVPPASSAQVKSARTDEPSS
jgi:hypothetical protein